MSKSGKNDDLPATVLTRNARQDLRDLRNTEEMVDAIFGFVSWIPLTEVGKVALKRHLDKKRQEARNILIEELQSGYHGRIDDWDFSDDELLDTLHRWALAARNGTARKNLKLLTQIMIGQKKERGHDSDQFRRWASILEDLSRDELFLIGISHRAMRTSENNDEVFWKHLTKTMNSAKYTRGEIEALCASVSRTGLLRPVMGYGGGGYAPTPWLKDLEQLANIGELSDLPDNQPPKTHSRFQED